MFKLGVVLFCFLIAGEYIGSLTGNPIPLGSTDEIQVPPTALPDFSETISERLAKIEHDLAVIKETLNSINISEEPKDILIKYTKAEKLEMDKFIKLLFTIPTTLDSGSDNEKLKPFLEYR